MITGDGALGHPARAPYDRIISTAAVTQVPYAWVAQTRPGGRVLTPWATAYYPGGLLSLTVDEDGTATGGIVGDVSFMWLRDQQPAPTYTARSTPASAPPAAPTCTPTTWLASPAPRSPSA